MKGYAEESLLVAFSEQKQEIGKKSSEKSLLTFDSYFLLLFLQSKLRTKAKVRTKGSAEKVAT